MGKKITIHIEDEGEPKKEGMTTKAKSRSGTLGEQFADAWWERHVEGKRRRNDG
jgi:hypothetical protein